MAVQAACPQPQGNARDHALSLRVRRRAATTWRWRCFNGLLQKTDRQAMRPPYNLRLLRYLLFCDFVDAQKATDKKLKSGMKVDASASSSRIDVCEGDDE